MEDFPDFERTRGSWTPDEGYQENKTSPRAAFVQYDSPDKPQPAIIISPGASLPAGVILTDRPLTPIESAYLPAIKALCEKNGAILAFMLMPMADSAGPIEISSQVLALGVPIIAASSEMMFGDISADRIKENYYDHLHFNSNGVPSKRGGFWPGAPSVASANQRLTNAFFPLNFVLPSGVFVSWPVCQHFSAEYGRWRPVRAILTCQICFFQPPRLSRLCYFGIATAVARLMPVGATRQRRLRFRQHCRSVANILYGNTIRRTV